jgi:hypothetical protein
MSKAEKAGQEIVQLEKDGKIDTICLKKYNKINQKMAKAAMELSGASNEEMKEMEEINQATDKATDQLACMEKCQSISDPMNQMTCIQSCQ